MVRQDLEAGRDRTRQVGRVNATSFSDISGACALIRPAMSRTMKVSPLCCGRNVGGSLWRAPGFLAGSTPRGSEGNAIRGRARGRAASQSTAACRMSMSSVEAAPLAASRPRARFSMVSSPCVYVRLDRGACPERRKPLRGGMSRLWPQKWFAPLRSALIRACKALSPRTPLSRPAS